MPDHVKDAVRVEHSPTPWEWDGDELYDRDAQTILGLDWVTSGDPANPRVAADRRLIVRAVNAHEALVDAAKDALRELTDGYDFDLSVEGMAASSSPGIQRLAATISRLNDAITLATEGR